MHAARAHWSVVIAALVGAAVLGSQESAVSAESLFPQLTGTWKGSGQVRFEQGKSEQISCRAYYTSKQEGSGLGLAIRCASMSYKIEMRASLSQNGDRISGHWEERTFNAHGDVSGTANGSNLKLAISGPITGTMAVAVGQAGHRVDIKVSGSGLAGVSIDLSRG
jgi:hypothetical protein